MTPLVSRGRDTLNGILTWSNGTLNSWDTFLHWTCMMVTLGEITGLFQSKSGHWERDTKYAEWDTN